MRRNVALLASVVLTISAPALMWAQPSRTDAYDMTKSIVLKGAVSAIVVETGSPVFIVLSVPGSTGQSEEWAIEGDSANKLIAAGWRPRMGTPIAVGDAVQITVHPLKGGADALALVPASETTIMTSARARRLAYGTEITLDGGKTITFGGNK